MISHFKPTVRIRPTVEAILKICLLVAIVIIARKFGDAIVFEFSTHLTPSTEPMMHRLIMVSVVVYVLLMMMPFVPGVEIGLALMIAFGAPVVHLVWGATVLALCLSFLFGRLLPEESVIRSLRFLRFRSLSAALAKAQDRPRQERVQLMVSKLSSRWVGVLLRHRLLLLIVAINLPGNSLIGGGGGIALIAGFSRLFSFPGFLLAMAVGTSPVPIAFLLSG